MEIIKKYFPSLSETQFQQLQELAPLYSDWNEKVNVISRKDVQNLYERHVLHSLSIAKLVHFQPRAQVLDVGTGGGFPGIPLAILFPETKFHLVDSIGKKIKVVESIAETLHLENVTAEQKRAEKVKGKFDFVVSRAVTRISGLYNWVRDKIEHESNHQFVAEDVPCKNGLICLKGGDLKEEFANFKKHYRFYDLADFFEEDFFETKKLVYVPI